MPLKHRVRVANTNLHITVLKGHPKICFLNHIRIFIGLHHKYENLQTNIITINVTNSIVQVVARRNNTVVTNTKAMRRTKLSRVVWQLVNNT